jgi:anaerobic magnesium-protoporphyrin IX monomethyl ester cyclase
MMGSLNMRITLVRPPFYSLVGVTSASHPLSLGYLSASLMEVGHHVDVVDGEALRYDDKGGIHRSWSNLVSLVAPHHNAEKNIEQLERVMNDYYHPIWDTVVKAILDSRPDVIGISCYTVSMTSVKILVTRIRKELPEAPIILGGIHVTSMPEQTLRDVQGATYVVIGEGERTIVELIDNFEKKTTSMNNVKGVAFLTADGKFVKTASRELLPNIDDLSLPTREWPGYKYGSHLGLSSRGCPFSCSFCDSRTIWTRKVRMASQNKMMTELEQIKNMGVTFFRYSDDTFTVDRKRISEWCKNVQANSYHKIMRFGFGTRIELITRECVEEYASSGVIDISFGIETGSDRIRKLISKEFRGTDPFNAVKIVNDAKIGTRTYFMIGHLDERPEDVKDTITLIKKMSSLPMNYVEVNVTCPYPGTVLWEHALKKTAGRQFVDIDTFYKMFHQNTPIINLTAMNDVELDKWIRTLYQVAGFSVLKSRARVWGRQLIINPIATIKLIKERVLP